MTVTSLVQIFVANTSGTSFGPLRSGNSALRWRTAVLRNDWLRSGLARSTNARHCSSYLGRSLDTVGGASPAANPEASVIEHPLVVKRWWSLALAVLLGLAPRAGGAQPAGSVDATAAIAALRSYLAANGKAAIVSGTLVMKQDQTVESAEGCRVVIRRKEENDVAPMTFDFAVPLDSVSPDIDVSPMSDGGVFIAKIVSSSGASSIPATRRSKGEAAPQHWAFVELLLADRSTADTVGMYLSRAIRACGGRPRTAAAAAQAEAEQRQRSQRVDSLLGRDLAPEERASVIRACHDRIRAQLKSPTTAKFPAEPSVAHTVGEPGLLVFGKVEAQNSYGGFAETSYICTFEQYGKQYVPKSAVLR